MQAKNESQVNQVTPAIEIEQMGDCGKDVSAGITKMTMPNFVFGNPFKCTYCGEPPSSYDHVIPLTQYTTMTRREKERSGIRTYACTSCNSTLGDRYFAEFGARLKYIQKRIIQKSQKFKRTASWTDEEIAELDHTLRTHVANAQIRMRQEDRRTTWQDSLDFIACMETLNDIPHLDDQSPKFVEWLRDYFRGFA